MKKLFSVFVFFFFFWLLPAEGKTLEEQRLDTLRFGTETEIASLIQTLKNDKVDYLNEELIALAQKTRNRGILEGIFGFFGEMEKSGLEDRAIKAVKERESEANETVLAAVDYLGKVKAGNAIDPLEELINSGESRFLASAIRALGRAGKGQVDQRPSNQEPEVQIGENQSSEEQNLEKQNLGDQSPEDQNPKDENPKDPATRTALFLLDYYNNRNPAEENKSEIIVALGETGSKESVFFLSELVKKTAERAFLRMAALDALAKIGDNEGLDAVLGAVSSADPNVRSSAIAALGPFSGEEVDSAILEGFRDSHYRTRIGSAVAAGKRHMDSAVPYLRYRAENDEVPAVKDEAIKALGAINSDEAMSILDSLFSERKNVDRVRILAADMLLRNNADVYGSRVFIEMEEAQNKKQTPLYNGFIRIMGTAKSGSLENLARRFISGGGVIEKSLALDLILNNEFRGLAENVSSLLDEKKSGASIARKAKSTLEKLGLDAETPDIGNQ